MAALRSLLARSTTTLLRAPSSASGPVVRTVPRISLASSSPRYYTSEGGCGYDRTWDMEHERMFTRCLREFREDFIKDSRIEKTWSLGPIGVALGFGACTAAGLGAGYPVGFVCGALFCANTLLRELEKKKLDEAAKKESDDESIYG